MESNDCVDNELFIIHQGQQGSIHDRSFLYFVLYFYL